MQIRVKFTRGFSTILTFTRFNGGMNAFDHILNKPGEVRMALLTLRELMIEKLGGEWKYLHQQNLLTDEYMVKNGESIQSSIPTTSAEYQFENTEISGLGCYDSTKKQSKHFPPTIENEDVFKEDVEIVLAADVDAKKKCNKLENLANERGSRERNKSCGD
jgi:hypothetical protein